MSSKLIVLVALTAPTAVAQVLTYEGNVFPNEAGFEILEKTCEPEEWVQDGWFFQRVELCPEYPPPGGQSSTFHRWLSDFEGLEDFHFEWRLETNAERSEIPFGGGAGFAAGNIAGVGYAFFIAEDLVKLNRDNRLPIIFVEIEPGMTHTYRLELYSDRLYTWYLDGTVVDLDVPEGNLLRLRPEMVFSARTVYLENTTKWDYVRLGNIPDDGSSDFDSDEDVDLRDGRYFAECMDAGWGGGAGGPGADAGPGCRWADADGDTDVDLRDFAAMQDRFMGDE